jgi:regulatory protein
MTPRRITAISPSDHKVGRFVLEVDGHQVATLSIEAIERLRLATGGRFDDSIAAAAEHEQRILSTYDRALTMLAARGRASEDLRRSLVRKGEPADGVNAAIDRLQRAGVLDDARFAREYTRSRVLGGGMSRRRVQHELVKRGVPRDVSLAAIDAVFIEEGVDEASSIERVARKKLRTFSTVDASARRRRLYAFLARRGYDADSIAGVIRMMLADNADEAR